jgi:hypothetical protein
LDYPISAELASTTFGLKRREAGAWRKVQPPMQGKIVKITAIHLPDPESIRIIPVFAISVETPP